MGHNPSCRRLAGASLSEEYRNFHVVEVAVTAEEDIVYLLERPTIFLIRQHSQRLGMLQVSALSANTGRQFHLSSQPFNCRQVEHMALTCKLSSHAPLCKRHCPDFQSPLYSIRILWSIFKIFHRPALAPLACFLMRPWKFPAYRFGAFSSMSSQPVASMPWRVFDTSTTPLISTQFFHNAELRWILT